MWADVIGRYEIVWNSHNIICNYNYHNIFFLNVNKNEKNKKLLKFNTNCALPLTRKKYLITKKIIKTKTIYLKSPTYYVFEKLYTVNNTKVIYCLSRNYKHLNVFKNCTQYKF